MKNELMSEYLLLIASLNERFSSGSDVTCHTCNDLSVQIRAYLDWEKKLNDESCEKLLRFLIESNEAVRVFAKSAEIVKHSSINSFVINLKG